MYQGIRRVFTIAGLCLGSWLLVQFLLPLCLPFLAGGALALGAEPMVGFLCRRLKLRRGAAAGIGVTATFCLLLLLLLVIFALIFREVSIIFQALPSLEQAASQGLAALSRQMLALAGRLPGNLGTVASRSLEEFFSGSSRLLGEAFRYVLGFTGGILGRVPGSALILGTAVISSYMISVRLPSIRRWSAEKFSGERIRAIRDGLIRIRQALAGWLRAQAKLMGITFLILTMGLVLLRIPYAPLWAGIIALVDAFPVLGTGTVLLPWSLISLLQQDTGRAIGLLAVYTVISLTRSILEPKLLGSHLGLDPLATLAALYAGYRLWGFGGLILAPMLAVAAAQLLRSPGK